ncbi:MULTISPECIES: immunity 49 family protein [unclassified Streptomyces]|uniref:immunity 49 family protein n=1 Tax=unclassified Streptomyces TaxID=2593676 RepID=UPI00331C009C
MENAGEGLAVLKETAEWVLGELEEPDGIGRGQALNTLVTVAQTQCALDPEAGKFETWEAWVTAMQVGCALFEAATASEGPVPCRIGSHEGPAQVRNLPATGPTPYTHAGSWLTSWYLATICRENDRLDRLARVPISVLRASGATFDEYVYDWVEALQNYWFRRASETWDKLVAAINGTDPEQIQVTDRETMLKQLYPPLELFQLYNRREQEKFNSSLVEFLNWHKQYWTSTEERSQSTNGLVPLGLLAMVCMAYDNDMPISVETEYLPKHLVKRSWVGEYDT